MTSSRLLDRLHRRVPLLLLSLLVILTSLPHPTLSLIHGPTPQLPPLNPNAPLPIPAHKTAYVTVHTHTSTAYAYYQPDGILTMYSTLADTNTTRPRIVLVTADTPQHIRTRYSDAHLTVREIPGGVWSDQCAFKFNKLHAWDSALLPEYERVIYLEPDVLVLYNIDHLFQCGAFCMVYSSLFHFTDSLLVIRPDAATHARLLHEYSQLRLDRLWSGTTWCPEHSWWFFLATFGDIEAAPLFKPADGQSQLPLQRLTSSYCLNAMTWYEFFSYRLLRGPAFRNYTDADGIPAYAIGWTGLKPYNWATGLFFNLQWQWADERDARLGRTYGWMVARWVVGCATLLWVALYGVRGAVGWLMRERKKGETGWKMLNAVRAAIITVMGAREEERRKKTLDGTHASSSAAPSPVLRPVAAGAASTGVAARASMWSLPYYWLQKLGVTPLAIILAFVMINVNGWTLYLYVIDRLVPSHIGYSLMCTAHCLLTYIDLQLLRYLYHFSPQYLTSSASSASAHSAAALDNDEQLGLMADIESSSPSTTLSVPTTPTPSSSSTTAHAYTYSYASQLTYSPLIRLTPLSLAAVVFWEWFTWLAMRPLLYGEFVIKMFAIFPLVAALFVAHVNVWRYVLAQMQADIEERSGLSGRAEGGALGGVGLGK